MSGAQQTCPFCDWYRWQDIPDQMVGDHRDEILEHVARSLQWEWQVHATEMHPFHAADQQCLTVGAFTSWVTGERTTSQVDVETPPGEGEGETVGVNLPTITPEQAKQLAEAVEHTMITVADSIQHFAEHAVPAIRAAQETLTDGLRRIVEQSVERRSADVLRSAATLAPGTRGPEFWKNLYGNTPVVQPSCQCDGTRSAHLRGDPGCLFLDAAGTLNPDDLRASQQRWAERFAGEVGTGGVRVDPLQRGQRETWIEPGAQELRPFGTVDAEICSNCQRLTGEPHGLPSCAELS